MGHELGIGTNAEEQAAFFSALADPTRLKLLKLLCRQSSHGALCVNALADLLGVTQSAVSQHLRVLRGAGLVTGERRGYHIHYFVNMEVLERHRNLVLDALSIEMPSSDSSCLNDCHKKEKSNVSRR